MTILLQDMADSLAATGDEGDAGIIRQHCEKGRWFKAGAEAFEYLGKAGFFDVMRRRFDVPPPADADWSLPDAIWRMQPSIVLTTNYDNVLAWRKPESRRLLNDQLAELAQLYRAADAKRPTVWHLHGHIERADSLILAPIQYEAFYGDPEQTRQQYRAATDQLRALLTNWTLLFIGFGMQDEYVMQLVGDVLGAFGGATNNHFALMKAGEADETQLWKEHNVRVIEYTGHGPPLVAKLDEFCAAAQHKPAVEPDAWSAESTTRRPIVPPAYTDWLANQCSQDVELSGLRPKHGQAVTLRNVYVPVMTRGGDITQREQKRARSREFAMPGEERPDHQLLQSLVAEKSLYVSGPPGSGKTTFSRWLTLAVCLGELPPHPIPLPDAFEETFPQQLRGRLPLLVRLRDFWQSLPQSAGGDELTWSELEKVLEQWITRKNFAGLAWSVVKDHLDTGAALLIFDGVDEVPLTAGDSLRTAQPRQLLLAGLADAVARWTAVGNRVLVTSRPYGLSDIQRQRLGLPHAPLAELPGELQRLLVRRWFHCLRKDAAEAESAYEELWADVEARPEIAELAANPLLLTAICIVYGENRKLPQDEFDLYDRIVDTVLFNRYPEQSSAAAAARSRLCVIAHGMHTGDELGEPRDQPRPEATVDEIDRMLQYYQDNRPGSELHKLHAHQAREDLLSQSGLLLPQGDDRRAAFYHFTFQDFLAAERLYDLHADKLAEVFQRRGEFAEWRKALGLLYGALLHKRSTPDQAVRLLTEQIQKEYSWWKNACLPVESISFARPFQLSKYSVTNGQFARFVSAGGYGDQSQWHAAGWRWREENKVREPEYWRDAKWNGPTQPVVGVSWWEADAFCRWAGCRLPTEREWEAAARGPQGWAYPWEGDWREGICNSNEADLGVTTPVGIFPESVAVCGAHDMAGNVWEWCDDTLDTARVDDPDAGRVLRGGSWYNRPRNCRSAIRDDYLPEDRSFSVGFRAART